MTLAKNAALGLALFFAATGGAVAQDAPASPDEAAYNMSRACRAFINAGTDTETCRLAVRAEVDAVATYMGGELAKATAPVQFGAVNASGIAEYTVDPSRIMPGAQSHADQVGTGYRSKIDAACETLRALPADAPMAQTILAADACLMTTGVLTKAAGRDTATIAAMGKNLTGIAQKASILGL